MTPSVHAEGRIVPKQSTTERKIGNNLSGNFVVVDVSGRGWVLVVGDGCGVVSWLVFQLA